ncbi:DUF2237 family protein [Natronorarus salvus]|uniref:DUF2237 family protein n=1 Tax=Natronorarus salvus TaxID=3117733 RepID=UPI002F2628C6
MTDERNVLGTALDPCCLSPATGYLRDGHCRHVPEDPGRHEVCAVVTQEFLEFGRERGNDLITPVPEFEFPGLHPGDRWCVCLARWIEAEGVGCAPPVVLEATNEAVLGELSLEVLEWYEYEG